MQRCAALATLDTSGAYEQRSARERFMDEPQVPNLEQMDQQQARRFLTQLFSDLSAEHEYAIRHEDYAMEMPQSGEAIRGRDRMRQFQEAYPSSEARRIHQMSDLCVIYSPNFRELPFHALR
jgi:hypothetical protein